VALEERADPLAQDTVLKASTCEPHDVETAGGPRVAGHLERRARQRLVEARRDERERGSLASVAGDASHGGAEIDDERPPAADRNDEREVVGNDRVHLRQRGGERLELGGRLPVVADLRAQAAEGG